MMKRLFAVCLAAACLPLANPAAVAQSMVHALSGKVIAVYPKVKMTEVATDDGSSGNFQWIAKSAGPILFAKNVSEDTTAVDKFESKGDHVIVFYVGDVDNRTAVAVRDLGSAPVKIVSGTVLKCNRHDKMLTIQNSSGAEVSFRLDPKTVGDTENGVQEDFHFDFSKGQPVRVTAVQATDGNTALLIAPAM
jgi:hypothetical protein